MAWSSAALLAALSIAACENPSHDCTDVGCLRGTEVDIVTSDTSTLSGATITICVDNQCASAVVATPADPGVGAATHLSGVLTGVQCLAFLNADQTVDVVGELPEPVNPTNGSVYVAMLTAADGTVIVSRQWTAIYSEWTPNGPDCEPTCVGIDLTPG
jgi:hypothetical protein